MFANYQFLYELYDLHSHCLYTLVQSSPWHILSAQLMLIVIFMIKIGK